MAVSVRAIKLWRVELENRPGALASTLRPLADARADLKLVMGYRYAGGENRAAVEVYPVAGKKSAAAAAEAGLSAATFPALLVEGDDRPGLGYAIANAMAGAGIDMGFFVAQVIGRRHSTVIGFGTEADARKAASLIKKVAGGKK